MELITQQLMQGIGDLSALSGVAKWIEVFAALRGSAVNLPEDVRAKALGELTPKVGLQMSVWGSELASPRGVTADKGLLQALAAVEEIWKGTDLAKQACDLRRRFRRESAPAPAAPPAWLSELRGRLHKVSSAHDSTLPELAQDIERQAASADPDWLKTLADEFASRLEGLLARQDLACLDDQRLGRLLTLGQGLAAGKVLGPAYAAQLTSVFSALDGLAKGRRRTQQFSDLVARIQQTLDASDPTTAAGLLAEAEQWAESPDDLHRLTDLHQLQRQQSLAQAKARTAFGKITKLLDRMQWDGLADWAEAAFAAAGEISALAPYLPPGWLKDLAGHLDRLFAFAAQLPEAPSADEIPPSQAPVSHAEMWTALAEALESRADCLASAEELGRLADRLAGQALAKAPDSAFGAADARHLGEWEARLRSLQGEALARGEQWARKAQELAQSLWRNFWPRASSTVAASFRSRMDEYQRRHDWLVDAADLQRVKMLEDVQRDLDQFPQWSVHKAVSLPADGPPGAAASPWVRELSQRLKKIRAASQELVLAESAMNRGDIDACQSHLTRLDKLGQWDDNRRYRKVQEQLQRKEAENTFHQHLAENQFAEAVALLRAEDALAEADRQRLKRILEQTLAGNRRLRELAAQGGPDLSLEDLMQWCERIRDLKRIAGEQPATSKMLLSAQDQAAAGTLLVAAQERLGQQLTKRLRAEIPSLAMASDDHPAINRSLTDCAQMEALLARIQAWPNTPLWLADLRHELTRRHTEWQLLAALAKADFPSAEGVLASAAQDAAERSQWSAWLEFSAARHAYQQRGDITGLVAVLDSNWYGRYDCRLETGLLGQVALDVLRLGQGQAGLAARLRDSGLILHSLSLQLFLDNNPAGVKELARGLEAAPAGDASAAKVLQALLAAPRSQGWILILASLIEQVAQERLAEAGVAEQADELIAELDGLESGMKAALSKAETDLESEAEPNLAGLEATTMQVTAALELHQELLPPRFSAAHLDIHLANARNLRRVLEDLKGVQNGFLQAGAEAWWLVRPGQLAALRNQLDKLPAKFAVCSRLSQQLWHWKEMAGQVQGNWMDLLTNLAAGHWEAARRHWRAWQTLASQREDYCTTRTLELLADEVFAAWRAAGHRPSDCRDLESIVQEMDNNLQRISNYVTRFFAVVAQTGQNPKVLQIQLQECGRLEAKGQAEQARHLRQDIRQKFFTPPVCELLDQWPKVRTPLTRQAEAQLQQLHESEAWQWFQRGYQEVDRSPAPEVL
ncbi:MAG: hypothetical protein V1797_08665 [Pseudomonadota bacterium]